MIDAFKPKGDLPEWRLVYDLVKDLAPGTIVRYETLSEILGRDFLEARSPVYRAMKELQANDSKTLVNVPNVGYRVALAAEHAGLARKKHTEGRRKFGKALNIAKSADRSKLTDSERQRIDNLEDGLARQVELTRRLELRQSRTEVRVDDVESRVSDLEAIRRTDTESLEDRMTRMEKQLAERGLLG